MKTMNCLLSAPLLISLFVTVGCDQQSEMKSEMAAAPPIAETVTIRESATNIHSENPDKKTSDVGNNTHPLLEEFVFEKSRHLNEEDVISTVHRLMQHLCEQEINLALDEVEYSARVVMAPGLKAIGGKCLSAMAPGQPMEQIERADRDKQLQWLAYGEDTEAQAYLVNRMQGKANKGLGFSLRLIDGKWRVTGWR